MQIVEIVELESARYVLADVGECLDAVAAAEVPPQAVGRHMQQALVGRELLTVHRRHRQCG